MSIWGFVRAGRFFANEAFTEWMPASLTWMPASWYKVKPADYHYRFRRLSLLFISTLNHMQVLSDELVVVMPLVGRASFLQHKRIAIAPIADLCQCPQSGEPHFYVKRSCSVNFAASGCQCPQSGNPHFYKITDEDGNVVVKCVNALSRAILIST